jgi:hypothetical protein
MMLPVTPSKKILSGLFCLLIYANTFFAQGDIIAVLEIHGRILERTDKIRKGIPDLQINIEEHQLATNQEGRFSVKIPIYQKNRSKTSLKMGVQSPDYQIIHPLDGLMEIDTASYSLSIEVFVCGKKFDWDARQKIVEQQDQIRKLKNKHGLSQRRLNALNQLMLDTILHYENQRLAQQEEIVLLEDKLKSSKDENSELQKQLETIKESLRISLIENEKITAQLFEAKEERYLRQQEYFEKISTAFNDYLTRVNDMRNLLPTVKDYFKNGAYTQLYNSTIEKYEPAYLQINNPKNDLLQGVEHNWDSEEVRKSVEQTFDFLIQQVHHQHIKVRFTEINDHLANRRVNKAKQLANATHEELAPLILQAEKAIKASIDLLEKNI